jgi:hypothetical protein
MRKDTGVITAKTVVIMIIIHKQVMANRPDITLKIQKQRYAYCKMLQIKLTGMKRKGSKK